MLRCGIPTPPSTAQSRPSPLNRYLKKLGALGMEASALVAVLAERGRVDRVQLEQALVEAEVNRLEGLISETRRELSDGTLRPKPLDPVPLGYPTGARRLTTRL